MYKSIRSFNVLNVPHSTEHEKINSLSQEFTGYPSLPPLQNHVNTRPSHPLIEKMICWIGQSPSIVQTLKCDRRG